ncbi:hypothetical protein BC826DRAFT_1106213 [Russula brevipes]|nr:hypothetical protein BC826DRAFT_1106213 [Russula brevipes]
MRRVADLDSDPSHARNTSSTSSLATHSNVTARFLRESDVQGSMFSDVLLTRLESVNQFLPVVRNPSARAVLDREIDAAMLLARALLTHRNILAPISVLPPELLLRIFHLVPSAEPPSCELQGLRWISVTYVCRHWRQVALDDSSLWARISGYQISTAWISEVLARARNAPLTIDLLGAQEPETLVMFPAHFAHTREFRLCGLVAHRLSNNQIWNICNLEAPTLEHFELGAAVGSPIIFLETPFFKGMAPKLRTFTLSRVRVPWSFVPRGQLTQLKITQSNERAVAVRSSPGDSKSLIDLLINCPVLEILVLEFCIPHSITRPSDVQAIHLPRLSSLSLVGSSSRVANLFKLLKLPPSAALRMRCTSENTATHNDHHILPLLSAHFHNPASVEMKSFRVTLNHMERLISVAAYTYLPRLTADPSYVFERDVNSDAVLSLSFNALPDAENGEDILGRVCSMLPISNIEFLSISAPDNSAPDRVRLVNWGEPFQRCAKLTTIEASGRGTAGLLKELTPELKKATSRGKGRQKKLDNREFPVPAPSGHSATSTVDTPLIFPRLTSLFLTGLDFGKPVYHPDVLYGTLSTTLQRRKACKVPLKMLGIVHGIISTNRANALGKLVPEFLWTGRAFDAFDEFDEFDDFCSDVMGTEDGDHGSTRPRGSGRTIQM